MSDASSDTELPDIWNFKKAFDSSKRQSVLPTNSSMGPKDTSLAQKFEALRQRHLEIREGSKKRRERTQERRLKKQRAFQEKNEPQQGQDEEYIKEWQGLQSYLDINKHLSGPVSHGQLGPKTQVEQDLDLAVMKGDVDKAEVLSDKMAEREFGVRLHHAFEAKKYAEKSLTDKNKKRKNKLHWGFEAKQRWQMKGNM